MTPEEAPGSGARQGWGGRGGWQVCVYRCLAGEALPRDFQMLAAQPRRLTISGVPKGKELGGRLPAWWISSLCCWRKRVPKQRADTSPWNPTVLGRTCVYSAIVFELGSVSHVGVESRDESDSRASLFVTDLGSSRFQPATVKQLLIVFPLTLEPYKL